LNNSFAVKLSQKGEIKLPIDLICKNESMDYFFTISINPCIQVFFSQLWQKYTSHVSSMPKQKQYKVRPVFASVERVTLQDTVLVIPTRFIDRFSLIDKESVFLVENDKGFEIWDKEIYDKHLTPSETP